MTLQTYLTERYAGVGNQLGWTTTDWGYMVTDVLTLLGISVEASETDNYKLQLLGEYQMWKRALADVSLDIDVSADGASYKRGDLSKEQVKGMFNMAENAVRQWLPQVEDVIIETVEGKDPYEHNEDRFNQGL